MEIVDTTGIMKIEFVSKIWLEIDSELRIF